MSITTFDALRRQAATLGARRVAVAGADSPSALAAMDAAVAAGLAKPILIGDPLAVRARIASGRLERLHGAEIVSASDHAAAAGVAAELVARRRADILLKGSVRTDQLLRAVLDARHSLRMGRLLSDVLIYEDTLGSETRLVAVTDGGINVHPDIDALRQIIGNAVHVMHALGIERPKVALLSATEAVTDAVPSSVIARQLAAGSVAGDPGGCDVFGPLALDNALLESAARAKGIDSPVAGHVDIMVAPSLDAGNILGKAVKYYGGSITAHVVVGAKVPVLIPSRVESAEDKLHSIALGVLVHAAA
ncbi:MAG TPA: phosphate acyltransferase [Longimicrobiales bacterium]|nr:phosphate acyltransferase [Longimicrobiales bacterium]